MSGVPKKGKSAYMYLKKHNSAEQSRLKGGGQMINDKDMEKTLLSLTLDYTAKMFVSHRMIWLQAETLSSVENFTASCGWLDKCMK